MHTQDPIFDRIDRNLAAVEDWTEERVLENAQHALPAGDMMESFLGRLNRQTINGDPTFVVGMLTSIVLLRAYEVAESIIVECDEDHCWINRGQFLRRRRIVEDALWEVMRQGPYAVAETSYYGKSGMDMSDAMRGSRLPVVRTAWAQIKGNVAPFAYTAAARKAYRK